jgi:hypothetical protein
MSTSIKAPERVEPPVNGAAEWVVNVDITLKEKRAFTKAVEAAQAQNDETPLYVWMAQFIEKWPYKGDPRKAEIYDNLKVSEWVACMKHVMESFQAVAAV